MPRILDACTMTSKPYWMTAGSDGTRIAPSEHRQPITAEQIKQAEAELQAIAARIREGVER